jgi:hypothetical protein
MTTKSFRIAIFLITAFSLYPATQASSQPKMASLNPSVGSLHLKENESFLIARTRILKAGWKPGKMHSSDNYEYSGTEKEALERGIVEVYSCTVDAGSLCTFYYHKLDECLRVDTVGEQVKEMTVRHWQFECAPDWHKNMHNRFRGQNHAPSNSSQRPSVD